MTKINQRFEYIGHGLPNWNESKLSLTCWEQQIREQSKWHQSMSCNGKYYWMLQIVRFQSFRRNAHWQRWCDAVLAFRMHVFCATQRIDVVEKRLNKLRRFKVFKPVDPVHVHGNVCESSSLWACVCVRARLNGMKESRDNLSNKIDHLR